MSDISALSPKLLSPVFVTYDELTNNLPLSENIITLVNAAFKRSKEPEPEKWWLGDHRRFPTPKHLSDTVGEKGIMAVIYDENVLVEGLNGKVVACAAALPWKGGWEGEGMGTEEGWELKTVSVDGDVKYLKRGLAQRVTEVLERWIVDNEREKRAVRAEREANDDVSNGVVKLYILVAECINGVYWRKRGFVEVRRKTQGAGVWGCKTNFEMVVYLKDLPLSSKV